MGVERRGEWKHLHRARAGVEQFGHDVTLRIFFVACVGTDTQTKKDENGENNNTNVFWNVGTNRGGVCAAAPKEVPTKTTHTTAKTHNVRA